jgi:hypothetical protein
MHEHNNSQDFECEIIESGMISGRDELRDHMVALMQHAEHEISVYAPRYDGHLFNTRRLAQTLSRFITQHRRNRVRLLTEDGQQLIRDNDRLIELSRHLGEFLEMREVDEQDKDIQEMIVFTDVRGHLYQPNITRLQCRVDFNSTTATAPLVNRFNQWWGRSAPIHGITLMGL